MPSRCDDGRRLIFGERCVPGCLLCDSGLHRTDDTKRCAVRDNFRTYCHSRGGSVPSESRASMLVLHPLLHWLWVEPRMCPEGCHNRGRNPEPSRQFSNQHFVSRAAIQLLPRGTACLLVAPAWMTVSPRQLPLGVEDTRTQVHC